MNKQGLLNKTKCYLVGAMQYSDGQDWRKLVTSELTPLGITCFNPYQKPFIENYEENPEIHQELLKQMERREFGKVAYHMKNIRRQDLNLCDRSDFIIAHIIPHVASWGSAEELTTSGRAAKPTFIAVVGGIEKTPLWLMGSFPIESFFNSVEEIIEHVKMLDSGELSTNAKYWRLLKHSFR